MADLIQWLNTIPLAGLMLVVALGFSLGSLTWRGLSLGPAGGTILVALLLGRAGLSFTALYGSETPLLTVGDFGFALFIYSVGFEAGPRFFSSLFGGPGWRFVLVGAVVNLAALGLAVVFSRMLTLDDAIAAGLLSGALTSPPTYAAAEAVCSDPTALAVTFALTYPIGLAGVVLLVQFLPRLMGDDLTKGIDDTDDTEARRMRAQGPDLTRAFVVKNEEVIGKPLRELDLTHCTGAYITRLHREDDIRAVSAETELEAGDHLLVKGTFEELQAFEIMVGPEVYDAELRRNMRQPVKIRVLSRDAVGKTLADLEITKRFRCLVGSVERQGVVIDPTAELVLEHGDVAFIVGRRDNVRRVAQLMGRFVRSSDRTDIAVYAGGIFLGLLLGQATLEVFDAPVTLGNAGGLLLLGILLGRFRNVGLLRANVPRPARQLVRDLGILLFVAETGVKAGESSFGVMQGNLMPTLLACIGVTVLSVVMAIGVARWLLKMRPVDAWGSMGGGMTSSAALVAVKRAADSNEPALSYAAAYALASVLATIAGQVVVLLML
ncbi:MAG: TrkA C-terminal domain-containing protein [Planctomycetota bacterium]|nr:TrkA C-terminal domain-containing protein [Planctomycetota bacterium]